MGAPKKHPRKKPTRGSPQKRRPRRVDLNKVFRGGLRDLLSGITKLGGLAFLALTTSEEELRAAGGSLVEAMHGHRCGTNCWHAIGKTPEERQAWWDERMKTYEAGKVEREQWKKKPMWDPTVKFADPSRIKEPGSE